MLLSILNVLLLVFGFGFVIFWHELGHFLAAKWVGIKVEQFAVGFGQAVVCWRKGIGFTFGSSREKYEALTHKYLREQQQVGVSFREKTGEPEYSDEQLSRAATALGLGDTEYRLNWIPLGGYVKMLGQDDLRPGETFEDPRAYPNKSIRARMLVVSAGVLMNVLLAAIGFMFLFLYGFHAPAPLVGAVQPNSPAMTAGIQVGDRNVSMDGKYQYDFTKTTLTTALLSGNHPSTVVVQHPDGSYQTLEVTPRKFSKKGNSFMGIGIEPSHLLRGMKQDDYDALMKSRQENPLPIDKDEVILEPGQVITKINGEPVDGHTTLPDGNVTDEYWKLDRALQQSSPDHPVMLTVVDKDGKEVKPVSVVPTFAHGFGVDEDIDVAGLPMLPQVKMLLPKTSATGIVKADDIVTSVRISSKGTLVDSAEYPTFPDAVRLIHKAGDDGDQIDLRVLRDGKEIQLPPITQTVSVGDGLRGIGVAFDFAELEPTVATNKMGVPAGSKILAIDGKPVKNWFDIRSALQAAGDRKITIAYFGFPAAVAQPATQGSSTTEALAQLKVMAANTRTNETVDITLGPDQIKGLSNLRYTDELVLADHIMIRQTSNPITAAAWGITETRDFILQFYVTLQRMAEGSVDARNLMGPIGIAHAGFAFASRGFDWLIWFLSMISANLAVVNFLPIPIVDGGLFTFLILEKIQGKPLSHRAQQYLQIVGLALIIGIFVLVTYQDILRLVR